MIYVDSSIIIRLIEGNDAVRLPIETHLRQLPDFKKKLITSRLSCLECRCKPMRERNSHLLDLYQVFFLSKELNLPEISAEIVEKATIIRAERNFKTPDALHAATATLSGSDGFWTTDQNFKKCPDLNVMPFPSI